MARQLNRVHPFSMNPIGLNPNRFIIASSSDDPVVGFGQLVPHGSDTSELRSLFVKPEHRYSLGSYPAPPFSFVSDILLGLAILFCTNMYERGVCQDAES